MLRVRATTERVEIWGARARCKGGSDASSTSGIVIDDEAASTPILSCTAWHATFRDAIPTRARQVAAHTTRRIAIPESLGSASPRRLRTFLAGRYCADMALRAAGFDTLGHEVKRQSNGAPCWPAGCTGSIAHTDRVAIAVVASNTHVRSVGVDVEACLSPDAVAAVAVHALPELPRIVRALGADDQRALLATVGFSVKESLYKCLHPIVEKFFDFTEAEVTDVRFADGSVRVRLLSSLSEEFPAGREFVASLMVTNGVVTTLVALPTASVALLAADPQRRGSVR